MTEVLFATLLGILIYNEPWHHWMAWRIADHCRCTLSTARSFQKEDNPKLDIKFPTNKEWKTYAIFALDFGC